MNHPDYDALKQRVRELEKELEECRHAEKARQKAEKGHEKWRKNETLFQAIFEHTQNGVAVYRATDDGKDFVFIDINPSAEKLSRISKKDIVGKKVTEVFPSIREMGLLDTFTRVFKTGQAENLPMSLYKDKRITQWVENSVFKLPSGEIVAIYRDETERKKTEESLRDSEMKFRQVTENINDVFWIVSPDWKKVHYVSPAYEKIWGKSCSSLYAAPESWIQSLIDEDRSQIIQSIREKAVGNDSEFIFPEYRIRSSDGNLKWISAHGFPIYDEDGNIRRVVGIAKDITEEKEVKLAMEDSEERFRHAFEYANDGVCLVNADGIITRVNERMCEILGYEKASLEGLSVNDIAHPDDLEISPKIIKGYEQGKYSRRLFEKRYVHKKGHTIWGQVASSGIRDAEGNILYYIYHLRDITAHKQSEMAIRENEEKLRLALESANEGMWEWNLEIGKIFFDENASKMLGYNEGNFENDIGFCMNLIHPDERPDAERRISRYLHGETEQYWMEFRLRTQSGDYKWVRSDGRVTRRNEKGEPLILIGVHRDITELRQAMEEQERLAAQLRQSQKMESIGTLAGGIAHDFNNILAVIIGYAELLLDDVQKDSLVYDNLREILLAGIRARDLVKQILTFSRHSGTSLRPLELNPLVKEAVKMLRSAIPTSIEIREDICKLPLTVEANPSQLHQIVINLFTNAAHAMSEKGGILEISVDAACYDESIRLRYPDLNPGNYALLSVSDTGSGIPSEYRDKIFDPYFTTKEKGKGTGLGLAVVHGIVGTHGGHISVYSEPGHGSTFSIHLPVIQSADGNVPAVRQRAIPQGTEHILFVDDEPQLVAMQEQNLRRLGYTVTAVSSSPGALEIFSTSPNAFDVLVTDMTMPQVTGDQLAKKIRQIRPDIPVILCTGFSEKINSAKASELKIDGFLMKPVDKKKLAETIRKILDDRCSSETE